MDEDEAEGGAKGRGGRYGRGGITGCSEVGVASETEVTGLLDWRLSGLPAVVVSSTCSVFPSPPPAATLLSSLSLGSESPSAETGSVWSPFGTELRPLPLVCALESDP